MVSARCVCFLADFHPSRASLRVHHLPHRFSSLPLICSTRTNHNRHSSTCIPFIPNAYRPHIFPMPAAQATRARTHSLAGGVLLACACAFVWWRWNGKGYINASLRRASVKIYLKNLTREHHTHATQHIFTKQMCDLCDIISDIIACVRVCFSCEMLRWVF